MAPVSDKSLFERFREVAEQSECIERAHHVVEPVQVPCSVPTHFGKLHRVEARGGLVFRHALLDDAETFLFQRLCEHCKVQPGCVILCYSSGPSTLSRRNAELSGRIYELDFFGKMHEVTVHSSQQKRVVTS